MDEIIGDLSKELSYQDKIVVATSGGPDSMALLDLVNKVKDLLELTIICAHVNHNMREESKDEKVLVETFCQKNNVIFEYMEITEYGEDNFHNDARNQRYQFFEKLIKKYDAQYLFTAHHADDLAETILMRMMRGSTLKGYGGFPKVQNRNNYKIVRPLITKSKEEIKKYCDDENIPYAIDASNHKDYYTRNRFRKYIVPSLKEESNHFYKKMYKFSKTLLEYDSFVNEIVQEKIEKFYQNYVLNIELLKQEKSLIQTKIIEKVIETVYQNDLVEITDQHVKFILDMTHNPKPNMELSFPKNIVVRKNYNKITFEENHSKETEYKIEIKDKVLLNNGSMISIVSEEKENTNYICRLSKEDITLPLYVRNKKDGDKMTIKNMVGTKKVKEIFIENKVEKQARKYYPVVVDAKDKIVWLPGLKKSQFDKQIHEKCDIILKYTLKGEKDE